MRAPDESWYGIEAKRAEYPMLLRIRKLTPRADLEKLFILEWSYPEHDSSRLPSSGFYNELEHFENEAVDEIERRNLAVFVAAETGRGKIRYYFYTASVDSLAGFLNQMIRPEESVQFQSDEDPDWKEYLRLLGLIERDVNM